MKVNWKELPSVYVMADPRNAEPGHIRTPDIFYVGSTAKGFSKRVTKHLGSPTHTKSGGTNSPAMKHRIAEIKKAGTHPTLIVVEFLSFDTTKTELLQRERHWTELLRSKGAPLLNKVKAIRTEAEKQPKAPELHTRKCEYCTETFTTAIRKQRFCSRQCKHLALQRRKRGVELMSRECQHCGKPFVTFRSLQVYCSEKCKDYAKDKRQRRERRAKNAIMLFSPITKTCEVCAKDFETVYAEKLYCSILCRDRAHRERHQARVKATRT